MSHFESVINDILLTILSLLDLFDIKNVASASRCLHQKSQAENFQQTIRFKRYEKYAGGTRRSIDSNEKIVNLLERLGLKLAGHGSQVIFYYNCNAKPCEGKLLMNLKTWQNESIVKGTKLIGTYYQNTKKKMLDIRISDDILIRINCNDCSLMISPYLDHKIPINGNSLESIMQHYVSDGINQYISTGMRATWLSSFTVDFDSRVYQIPFSQLRNMPVQFENTEPDTIIKFDYEKNDPTYIKLDCNYTIENLDYFYIMYYHVKNNTSQLMDVNSFTY